MKIEKTKIEGILIIQPEVFKDDRGYFFESFRSKTLKDFSITDEFVQDNISKSNKGTVRGLHYQIGEKAQGKLCQVLYGKVLDVALDIRFNSATFGQHFSYELSEENHMQLFIPEGFAHGFSVLSDLAVFHYKCTDYYSKEHERSILFNDQDINIDWKVDNPIVSEKDLKAKRFKNIDPDFMI